MGNEFLRSKRQNCAKGWNHQLRAGAQDLLSTLAPGQKRGCRASIEGAMPRLGTMVVLQLTEDKQVVVRDENVCIGRVPKPKPDLIAELKRHSGLAVAKVRARLQRSGAIDLVLDA